VTSKEIADAEARLAAFEDAVELPLSIEYGERYGRRTVDHIHDAASKAYVDAVRSDGPELDFAQPLVTTDSGHYGPPAPVAEFWVHAPEDLRLALDALAAEKQKVAALAAMVTETLDMYADDTNADVSDLRGRLTAIVDVSLLFARDRVALAAKAAESDEVRAAADDEVTARAALRAALPDVMFEV
jgi:hypothetical protein